MTVKKSLENRIRGWLPKEPILPRKSTLNQRTGENKVTRFMNNSFVRILALGTASIALLTVSLYGTGLPSYVREISWAYGGVVIFAYIYIIRNRTKNSKINQT